MKLPLNFIAGLAGAAVLNVLHETARKVCKDAPEINKIGEEGVAHTAEAAGMKVPSGKKLYATALAADLIGNAFYYAMVGKGPRNMVWKRGTALGVTAGLGALGLTRPLGLHDEPVNKNLASQLMTIAWYTAGGLAAAAASNLLSKVSGKRAFHND